MIERAPASPLPVTRVTADSAYRQDCHFRRFLAGVVTHAPPPV
jgi:hypothetical protein